QVNSTRVDADFAPGDGRVIDQDIAYVIGAATRRVKVASMVISSGTILGALGDVMNSGRVQDFGGIYDATQMDGVIAQWKKSPNSRWKIALFEQIAQTMVGKVSTPYTPTSPHDFMHNKIVVVDDMVITGSFNLSNNAASNAENML